MERNLNKLSESEYDLIIIGGGITGAAVAWEAVLRGLKVALLEKKDFAHATSSATSKLIHGGLRYLKNFEISLVRESLKERRYLQVTAPHMVYPLPFLIPFKKKWEMNTVVTRIGLKMYDGLSYDRNRLPAKLEKLPASRYINEKEFKTFLPDRVRGDFTGGILYTDGRVYSPERHTFEYILSAVEKGANAANYTEVVDFLKEGDRIIGVKCKDLINDKLHEVKGKLVINASGPWADRILNLLKGAEHKNLIRSKGIHFLIPQVYPADIALAGFTPDKKHIFVIPWRGYTLIGTTDMEYRGEPDKFKVSEEDITELMNNANAAFPGINISRKDILAFYGGLRPLVESDKNENSDVYNASRKYEINDHEKEGVKGLLSAEGGKYTTSRGLAEKIVDIALTKLGKPAVPSNSSSTPLIGAEVEDWKVFKENLRKEYSSLEERTVDNLIRNYGKRTPDVLKLIVADKSNANLISKSLPNILAEIKYILKEEMCYTLEDLVFRRTGIGSLGHPGKDVLKSLSEIMGSQYKWDKARMQKEIETVESHYVAIVK